MHPEDQNKVVRSNCCMVTGCCNEENMWARHVSWPFFALLSLQVVLENSFRANEYDLPFIKACIELTRLLYNILEIGKKRMYGHCCVLAVQHRVWHSCCCSDDQLWKARIVNMHSYRQRHNLSPNTIQLRGSVWWAFLVLHSLPQQDVEGNECRACRLQ